LLDAKVAQGIDAVRLAHKSRQVKGHDVVGLVAVGRQLAGDCEAAPLGGVHLAALICRRRCVNAGFYQRTAAIQPKRRYLRPSVARKTVGGSWLAVSGIICA
jgi:hypothetical protein